MVARPRTTHHPRQWRWEAGGGSWTEDHPPPPTAPSLWTTEMGVPALLGQACCCHCVADAARQRQLGSLAIPALAGPARSECSASRVFAFPLASGADLTSLFLLWNYTLLSPFSCSWRETLPCQPLWGSLAAVDTTPCTAETELESILVKHREGPPLWQPRTLGTATLLFRHSSCNAGAAMLGPPPSHL